MSKIPNTLYSKMRRRVGLIKTEQKQKRNDKWTAIYFKKVILFYAFIILVNLLKGKSDLG